MGSAEKQGEDLWAMLARHGFTEAVFGFDGKVQTDCPYCGEKDAMVLNRITKWATCSACPVDTKLAHFVDKLDEQADPEHSEGLPVLIRPDKFQRTPDEIAQEKEEAERDKAAQIRAEQVRLAALEAQKAARKEKLGERIIMTLLALVFLGAGLAASMLSGFANYQAFSMSVADPVQGRIWGWAGVIASICSFGGFTFFWWHATARRYKEAIRAVLFALAGAGTSIAGTAMFMANNEGAKASEQAALEQRQAIIEAQITDWSRQLEGIPPETRTVEGLELYLAGVEAAGRTHQKPYRDAQNELGLAKRRDALEVNISEARLKLLEAGREQTQVAQPQSLPAWFFAAMLELFSSQGTSIAFISLLLLYGRGPQSENDFKEEGPHGLDS